MNSSKCQTSENWRVWRDRTSPVRQFPTVSWNILSKLQISENCHFCELEHLVNGQNNIFFLICRLNELFWLSKMTFFGISTSWFNLHVFVTLTGKLKSSKWQFREKCHLAEIAICQWLLWFSAPLRPRQKWQVQVKHPYSVCENVRENSPEVIYPTNSRQVGTGRSFYLQIASFHQNWPCLE